MPVFGHQAALGSREDRGRTAAPHCVPGARLGYCRAENWTAAPLDGREGWARASCAAWAGRAGLGPAVQPAMLTLESVGPRAQPSLRAGLQASALIGTTGASLLPSWEGPEPDAHPIQTPLLDSQSDSQAGETCRARGCSMAGHPASCSHPAHQGRGRDRASAVEQPRIASRGGGPDPPVPSRVEACLSLPTSDPKGKREAQLPPGSAGGTRGWFPSPQRPAPPGPEAGRARRCPGQRICAWVSAGPQDP